MMNNSRQEQVVRSKEDFQEELRVSADLKDFMISSDRDKVVIRLEMSLKSSKNSSLVEDHEARPSVKLNKLLKAKTSS